MKKIQRSCNTLKNVTFWNLIECDPGFLGYSCNKICPYEYYGGNVPTNAAVTKHRSVIMCADVYKSQSQSTAQMLYYCILSKPVFLLLTPALIVQVWILYLDDHDDDGNDDDDDDDDDDEKKSLLQFLSIQIA